MAGRILRNGRAIVLQGMWLLFACTCLAPEDSTTTTIITTTSSTTTTTTRPRLAPHSVAHST